MTPEKFANLVIPEPNSGCHLYIGAWDGRGYGAVRHQGRQLKAHRYAWELAHGPIAAGLWVLHKCDTPCCVNPDHLYLGTILDNGRDMGKRSRGRRSERGFPRGICPHTNRSRGFQARLQLGRRRVHLGTFPTIDAAAIAIAAFRKENP